MPKGDYEQQVWDKCERQQNRVGRSIDKCKNYKRKSAMILLYVVMLPLLLAYLTT